MDLNDIVRNYRVESWRLTERKNVVWVVMDGYETVGSIHRSAAGAYHRRNRLRFGRRQDGLNWGSVNVEEWAVLR